MPETKSRTSVPLKMFSSSVKVRSRDPKCGSNLLIGVDEMRSPNDEVLMLPNLNGSLSRANLLFHAATVAGRKEPFCEKPVKIRPSEASGHAATSS